MDLLPFRDVILAVSLGATLAGVVSYLFSIFKGHTRPHLLSWIIWTILTGVACSSQLKAGAGIGAWTVGLSCLGSFVITVLAAFKGERRGTRSDYIAFTAAILTIPVWLSASNPLWAVVLVTAIDTLGFYPTYRKSWHRPFEEDLGIYALMMIAFGSSLVIIVEKNMVTALYPAMVAILNGCFVVLCLLRRKTLSGTYRRPG